MISLSWKFDGTTPLFQQVANRVRADILNKKYLPDEQLPSVRQFAFEASVNPNTMQKALSLLEAEGLLYTKGTAGRFVTSDPSTIECARSAHRRLIMHNVIKEASEAGVSAHELLKYIKEEYGYDS